VRVRLPQIEFSDLNVFEFDYDLTFMVFFLNADEQIYGRYGSRDEHGPESRMSLAGLNYAMRAALDNHRQRDRSLPVPPRPPAKTVRHFESSRYRNGCIHCHQVKEIMQSDLKRAGKWDRDMVWRYPLPDNLGMLLEIDRGNVVARVDPRSPAGQAGLQPGDVLRRVGATMTHSQADVQFALDKAPATGTLPVAWQRGSQSYEADVALPEHWRKTVLVWRASAQGLMPSLKLFGRDLSSDEKRALGLAANRMVFEHRDRVIPPAVAAGVQPGDIILGLDGQELFDMTSYEFRIYVQRRYLVGDVVKVNVLRAGERLDLSMTLGE
jgi:serine protease Do